MHAVRQKCRPKHQVLVLKCYPRHMKNNVEVKPNSSELSYLLYYASTRRSKLQKVGDFLDKRTTSDVWKVRIGNIQVTLLILKALIEKCPRDLPLYAGATLRIFRSILRSCDITMIESTLPTFAAFCNHQDPAILAADQDYIRQYEEIVEEYARFASKLHPIQHKSAKSVPVKIRFRKAGLLAIKAIAESDSLASETSTQLAMIIPPILENLYAENGQFLQSLEDREEETAGLEKELALRRRQSTATVRTVEPGVADQAAASGTTEAADRIAEQETGVIALQALKKIFTTMPKGPLRLATAEVLKFMTERINPNHHFPAGTVLPMHAGSWPCAIFGMVCGWAAVQDRYVILLTAAEAMIQSPLNEEVLEKQYVLATIVGWLLSSDINFIGLSIMDVLVGLLQHILALLQHTMHSTGSPRLEATEEEPSEATDKDEATDPATEPTLKIEHSHSTHQMSENRCQLLAQLQRCIGCLAVHVYYSDQVSDMITAVISMIKPSTQIPVASSASTIDNGVTGADIRGSSTSLPEKPNGDRFFSFEAARVAALDSIKEILKWANWTNDRSSSSTSRSTIGTSKWEGTQWLLRDNSWKVRTAYVDVLLVWLRLEVKKMDLRVREDISRTGSKSERKDGTAKESSLARRAVSNASQREKSPRRAKNTFLQLLHLAAYDNAHHYATSEDDILLLHLLLSEFALKLGANSVQHGLPMIMRLQEDIFEMQNAKAQVNVGSLVHGYLWAISVYFSFDASATGREVSDEVSRRMQRGIWLAKVQVPPMKLEDIAQRQGSMEEDSPPPNAMASEELQPFDRLTVFVDKIAEGYSAALYSPPNSPPTSPNRKYSTPMLDQSAYIGPMKPSNTLLLEVKERLLQDWTREACIVATSKQDGSRSGSLSGSPTATTLGRHLTVGVPGQGVPIDDGLPSPRRSHQGHHPHIHTHSPFRSRPSSAAPGTRDSYHHHALREAIVFNAASGTRSRLGSQSGSPMTAPSSIRGSVRVEDLKNILNGGHVPIHTARSAVHEGGNGRPLPDDDSASDSMMSYEGSEMSYAQQGPALNVSQPSGSNGEPKAQMVGTDESKDDKETTGSGTTRPQTAGSLSTLRQHPMVRKSSFTEVLEPEDIPPVPPLPSGLHQHPLNPSSPPSTPAVAGRISRNQQSSPSPPNISANKLQQPKQSRAGSTRSVTVRESLRRSISTRDGTSQFGPSSGADGQLRPGWNVMDLLETIDMEGPGAPPGSTAKGLGNGIKPPY